MSVAVKVGGTWLPEVGAVGDLEWTTKYGEGGGGRFDECSWSMDLPDRHPLLKLGALVELMDGPARLGMGVMLEPDADRFTARGLCRRAEDFYAFTGPGASTSIPNVAIDTALSFGLEWQRAENIGSAGLTESGGSDSLNRLNTLLDGHAEQSGYRWWVDENGFIRRTTDPTVPTWHVWNGPDLAPAGDGYAAALFGRYRDLSGDLQTAYAEDAAAGATWGYVQEAIDLTGLGALNPVKAVATLNGLLAKGKSRPGFAASLEVTAGQITTAGGIPADLSMVYAGQMVRTHGLFSDAHRLDGATYLDWVIGETRYKAGADTITLSPLGLAPVDFLDLLASLVPRNRFAA